MPTIRSTAKSVKASKSAKPTAKKKAAPKAPKPAAKPIAKPAAKTGATRGAKPTTRMSLAEAMRALEKAGSEKTRRIYLTYGAEEPLFGVMIGTLFTMVKNVGVDHDLALQLWKTGNHDARIFAMKIADPATIAPADLDRWAREHRMRGVELYVATLAAESPHGVAKGREWLASSDVALRKMGWTLAGRLADLEDAIPDEWFAGLIERIEKSIHSAPSPERGAMNAALIAIGGRSAALRTAATAAAKRIGPVAVDHGGKACTTPDAVASIDKRWERAAKRFPTPAAHERSMGSMRTRC